MQYTVSRNGQTFGPYTLEALQAYKDSGNILLTDLVNVEGSTEWVTVATLLGVPEVYDPVPYSTPAGAPAEFAPNMHWAVLLLLTVCTCGIFYIVWLFILGARMKKIVPANSTWMLYFAGAALYAICLVMTEAGGQRGPTAVVSLAYSITLLVARFRFRSLLEEYYNSVEPVGLTLSGVMTFFFGELYFQYHFSRIRQLQATGSYGV
jgi:hypothetical protein